MAAAQSARTHCPKGHPFDEVNTHHRPTGGRGCKPCRREAVWRQRGIHLQWEQYLGMVRETGNRCEICGRPPKTSALSVDHRHSDGLVRGLLCYRCNRRVLGRLTLEQVHSLVRYLEKYELPKSS